ncbi:keratin, type I cytoskeletal 9-like [Impatiens glandulifera]|uniref:keratin, type I cytoskeletal 9-like n=1 Tax=Impatiens glandulifera TaxID=253017 RepID=UPI001FB16330|nr:keratin, type I cytoskeletal 9-like [Impatiens glandulifera]
MDVFVNNADIDEQAATLLIEFGNLSAEERRLLAQPIVKLNKEPIQENPSLEEEEEEIIQYLHENILHPLHSKRNQYEIFQRAERELEEEEQNKTGNEFEKGEPEQSLQIHTEDNPIQSMAAESQDDSSNEGSSADGTKLLKSMTSLFSSLQTNVMAMGSHVVNILKTQKEDRKEVVECVKILKELDNTMKKNTFETHVSNSKFSKFEQQLFSTQSEMMSLERQINLDNHREVMDSMELYKNQFIEIQGSLRITEGERLEYADSIARKFQQKENAKVVAEIEQTRITQGEPSRRGNGVSTGTRSKRAPTNDENPRPTKRRGGRSGGDSGGQCSSGGRGGKSGSDRGGRSSGGDRGGRSSRSGRGGRALPPFQNLLTSEGVSGGGFNYPIDPRVKREEQ